MNAVEVGPLGHGALLRSIVRELAGIKVLVLGDPMLDYYHFGHVDRLSPEAPVPVFVEDKLDLRDGGAANVSQNLTALGCTPINLFPPAPHTTKHRYLVGSQQLFRIDRDKDHSLQVPEIEWLPVIEAQAIIISDYAKGWCTPARCQGVIKAAADFHIPVVVDPKGDEWTKYEGATVICPNEKEMLRHYDSHGFLVHKRGPQGLTVIYPDHTENTSRRARVTCSM